MAGVFCPSCNSFTNISSVTALPDNPYVMLQSNNNQHQLADSVETAKQVYQLIESSLGQTRAFKLLRSRKVEETTQFKQMLDRLGERSQEILVFNINQQSILAEVEVKLEDLKRKMADSINPRDQRSLGYVQQKAAELERFLKDEAEFSGQELLKDSIHNSQVKIDFSKPAEFLSCLGAGQDKLFIDMSVSPGDDPNVMVIKRLLGDLLTSTISCENPLLMEMTRAERRQDPVDLVTAAPASNITELRPFASELLRDTDIAQDETFFSHDSYEDNVSVTSACDSEDVSRKASPKAVSSVTDSPLARPSFSDVAKKPAVLTPPRPRPRPTKISKKLIKSKSRPYCYFQLQVEREEPFRVVFELRPDMAPKMVENFIRLCNGSPGGHSYRGSKIYRAKKEDYIAGGDIENNDGSGGHSSYPDRHFLADQCTLGNSKGALRMKGEQRTIDGRCRVSSKYMIWVDDLQDKDFKYSLVFGTVVDGLEELLEVSKIKSTQRGPKWWAMKKDVTVIDCGTL